MASRIILWHEAKTKLNTPRTAADALKQAGLTWAVLKTDIVGGLEPPPGRKFVVREDLWSMHDGAGLLGTTRENDEPMQLREAFGLLDPIVASGAASYDAAGVIGEHTWPWMILRLFGDLDVAPGDSIGRFVLFIHSPALGYYRLSYLPVRLASASTIAREDFHNPDPRVTIPNDRPRRFDVPLNQVLHELGYQFDDRINEFRAMARIQLDEEILQRYLKVVVEFWTKRLNARMHSWMEGEFDEQKEICLRECSRLFEEGMGNDLPFAKGTLWAACNAVTEYVDFFKLNREEPDYMYRVWFDPLKQSAIQVARELIKTS
jgi:Domain of unknown function (DUF932)